MATGEREGGREQVKGLSRESEGTFIFSAPESGAIGTCSLLLNYWYDLLDNYRAAEAAALSTGHRLSKAVIFLQG